MTRIRRNPVVVPQMMRRMDNFLNTEFADWSRSNHSRTGTTIPAVNVKENEEAISVEMAAPGMRKEDFKINLDGNKLTISSHLDTETHSEQEGHYALREFSYQSFQRVFTLSEKILDTEKIHARYEAGVLYLVLPKREEVKPRPARLIDVQ